MVEKSNKGNDTSEKAFFAHWVKDVFAEAKKFMKRFSETKSFLDKIQLVFEAFSYAMELDIDQFN